MGHELKRVDFKVKDGELLDVNVKMKKELRSVIHGVVVDEYDKPIEDAVVILFKRESCESCDIKPVTYGFTDDCGQFVFGPLTPKCEFVVKVWVNGASIVDIFR